MNLRSQPDVAKEGTDRLTLNYSILQVTVEKQIWCFNGSELKNNLHYLVEERSLVILRPNRSDTGRYTVLLTNPFSNDTAHKDVTVYCKNNENIFVSFYASLSFTFCHVLITLLSMLCGLL